MAKNGKQICVVCSKEFDNEKTFPVALLADAVFDIIQKDFSSLSLKDHICYNDLDIYRTFSLEASLSEDHKKVAPHIQPILKSYKEKKFISKNIHQTFHKKLTFGAKLSDKFTNYVGSWTFIIEFIVFMVFWVILNSQLLLKEPFDPFPYILLNLFLSMIAAIQAPLIMMSQNRQEDKDRLRAEHDFEVNFKAELEIRNLHEKLDRYTHRNWKKLEKIEKDYEKLAELLEEIHKNSSVDSKK